MYSMRLVVYSMRLVAIMSTMGLVGYEPHSVSNDTTTEAQDVLHVLHEAGGHHEY